MSDVIHSTRVATSYADLLAVIRATADTLPDDPRTGVDLPEWRALADGETIPAECCAYRWLKNYAHPWGVDDGAALVPMHGPRAEWGRVSVRYLIDGARGSYTVERSRVALQRLADLVAALPGARAAIRASQPKKPRPAVSWPAVAIRVFRQAIDDKNYADALRIASQKLGGRCYQCEPGSPGFLMVAPMPVDGFPAGFVSAMRDDGKHVVFDTVSGFAVDNVGRGSRRHAEEFAREKWQGVPEEKRAAVVASARASRPISSADALAEWCKARGFTDWTDDAEAGPVDPSTIEDAAAAAAAADAPADALPDAAPVPADAAPMHAPAAPGQAAPDASPDVTPGPLPVNTAPTAFIPWPMNRALPIFARVAIERLQSDSALRTPARLAELLTAYAGTYGETLDDSTAAAALTQCASRWPDAFNPAPVDPAPAAAAPAVSRSFIRPATSGEQAATEARDMAAAELAEHHGRPVEFRANGAVGPGFYLCRHDVPIGADQDPADGGTPCPGNDAPAAQAPADKPRRSLNEARADAALARMIRCGGEVMTRREFVQRKLAAGLALSTTEEDRIAPMSRMAAFRANNEQQQAHEKRIKAAGTKTMYWIGGFEVTKTEFDYAQTLAAQSQAAPADAIPHPGNETTKPAELATTEAQTMQQPASPCPVNPDAAPAVGEVWQSLQFGFAFRLTCIHAPSGTADAIIVSGQTKEGRRLGDHVTIYPDRLAGTGYVRINPPAVHDLARLYALHDRVNATRATPSTAHGRRYMRIMNELRRMIAAHPDYAEFKRTGRRGEPVAAPAPRPEIPDAAPVYRYALVYRPADIGTVPRGLEYTIEARPAAGAPHHDMARHGVLCTGRELTPEECRAYELASLIDGGEALESLAAAVVADGMGKHAAGYVSIATEDPAAFADTVLHDASRRDNIAQSIGDPAALVARVLAMLQALAGTGAPTRETEAPAAMDAPRAALQPLPVSAYRVERRYANGAVIRPLPGCAFNAEDVQAVAAWFRAAGWEVSTAAPAGVSALNNIGQTVDDIPEPYTAAQRKRDEKRAAIEAAADARRDGQRQELADTAAGRYVVATFGDALNSYNGAALARYLAGDAATFGGLMSARAADVVAGLGIATDGRTTAAVLADLKAHYTSQPAPGTPCPENQEPAPAAADAPGAPAGELSAVATDATDPEAARLRAVAIAAFIRAFDAKQPGRDHQRSAEMMADRLLPAIAEKNADVLLGYNLGSADMNPGSRAAFEAVTGVKLPKARGASERAIDQWAGVTEEQRAAKKAARAAQCAADAADREAQAARRDAAAIQVNDGARMVDGGAWVDDLIAQGFAKTVQRGPRTYLANAAGNGWPMMHKDIARYARAKVAAAAAAQAAQAAAEAVPTDAPVAAEPEPAADAAPASLADRIMAELTGRPRGDIITAKGFAHYCNGGTTWGPITAKPEDYPQWEAAARALVDSGALVLFDNSAQGQPNGYGLPYVAPAAEPAAAAPVAEPEPVAEPAASAEPAPLESMVSELVNRWRGNNAQAQRLEERADSLAADAACYRAKGNAALWHRAAQRANTYRAAAAAIRADAPGSAEPTADDWRAELLPSGVWRCRRGCQPNSPAPLQTLRRPDGGLCLYHVQADAVARCAELNEAAQAAAAGALASIRTMGANDWARGDAMRNEESMRDAAGWTAEQWAAYCAGYEAAADAAGLQFERDTEAGADSLSLDETRAASEHAAALVAGIDRAASGAAAVRLLRQSAARINRAASTMPPRIAAGYRLTAGMLAHLAMVRAAGLAGPVQAEPAPQPAAIVAPADRHEARGIRLMSDDVRRLLHDGWPTLPGRVLVQLRKRLDDAAAALAMVPAEWSMSHGELCAAEGWHLTEPAALAPAALKLRALPELPEPLQAGAWRVAPVAAGVARMLTAGRRVAGAMDAGGPTCYPWRTGCSAGRMAQPPPA